MKRFLKWFGGIFVIVALIAFLVFQFYLKQKPFAEADDYWAQLKQHRLTPDVIAQWYYTLGTVIAFSHTQEKYFDMPSPYDSTMFKQWADTHKDDELALRRIYSIFSKDFDYGWPQQLQGVGWVWAIAGFTWAAPSIAIIDPGRSAEAAFVLHEFIELLRSPAGWKDFVIEEGWGDPMRDNMQWKGPLLIAEGLYTLMTGNMHYAPELQAIAHSLYDKHLENMQSPIGAGFAAGVACEPNYWFAQCNSMGILGLTIYDRIFGVDPKYNVKIGERYRTDVLQFIKGNMIDPDTKLVYREWHPYGPYQANKDIPGFPNILTASLLRMPNPEFAKNIYSHIRKRYIRRLPFGLGAFMLDIPERDAYNQLVNRGADQPGMIGESAYNTFLAMVATREFDDKETFDMINEFLTTVTRPYYRQAELRFDETNEEPSGIEDYTLGQILNMSSGWWLLGKVHLGWETILAYDWSKNRDKDGRLLNNP